MKQINKLIKLNDVLEVYVIGYKSMGESIVLNFANKFCGIIDCFETSTSNQTMDLLESLGIHDLDFICWTHTDADHTKGLSKIIEKFVDYDKTKFIMPEGFSPQEIFTQYKDYYDTEYSEIFNLVEQKFHPYNIISSNQNTVDSYSFKYSTSPVNLICNLQCYTPITSIVKNLSFKTIEKYFTTGKGKSKPNYFSIVLKLTIRHPEITPINLCFTSDLENNVLRYIPKKQALDCFGDNLLFKIPHHGSANANNVFQHIKSFGHAVTTSYTPSNLPKPEIIDEYKKYGGVVSHTGAKAGDVGIVKYKISLKKQPIGIIKIDELVGGADIL